MTGYVRQSSADIVPTAIVRAAPLNNEYNAIRDAFDQANGHKHDGTAAEGHYVPLIADSDARNKVAVDTVNNRVGAFVEVGGAAVEQVRIQDGAIVPVTDNDIDLGTSSLEFKDLYIDGTANIDSLIADTADINAGTIDNAVVGATTPAAATFTTLTSNGSTTLNGTTIPASKTLVVTTDKLSVHAATSSSELASIISDETGTGALVFANSPTLVTPALGTPSSATLTNATGLPLTSGVTGTLPVANGGTGITSFGAGVATFLGTPSSSNLAAAVTDETGTGALVFANSPTLVTPALGTPSSGVATNLTGLPLTSGVTGTLPVANGGTGITSFGTGIATFLGTPSSSNLAAAVTDETGTGALVFANSPTLVTPTLGTPASATLTNATGLPLSTGVTGTLPVANGGTNATTAADARTNLLPSFTGNGGKFVAVNSGATDIEYVTASGTGTVTSVAATVPSFLSVTGSPITASGTLAITYSGTALPIANGGTGATDAAAARTSLAVAGTAVSNTFSANQIISVADNTNAALRITQTGNGNALLVEDAANPDSTPVVIDKDGRVIVGYTAATATYQHPQSTTTFSPFTQIHGPNVGATIAATAWSNVATTSFYAPAVYLAKSASATVGTQAAVVSGEVLGTVNFSGDDGTAFVKAAQIIGSVDGTPGTNDMPGRLVFSTTADGSASPTERMRIDSAGAVTVTGTGIINANSSTDALRITQTGAGNALLVEDSANPDASPFVIDQSGNVYKGYTSNIPTPFNLGFQINGTAGDSGMSLTRWVASASCPSIYLAKSRGASVATRGIVSNGDSLGDVTFTGDDGTNFVPAAQIIGSVDGTPGTNDMPGRLVFSTTADGASTPTERMRITSAGNIGVGTASPAVNLEVSSATGSATPTPTEIRISTTTSAGDFSTSLPWGRLSFYSADVSDTGPKIQGAVDLVSATAGGGRGSMVFRLAAATTGTLTERTRITSTGQVGIASTAPSYQLQVGGNGQETANLTDSGLTGGSLYLQAGATAAGAGGAVLFGTTFGNSTPFAAIKGLIVSGDTNTTGDLAFSTRVLDTDTNLTEQMRLTIAGNVGLGTTTPIATTGYRSLTINGSTGSSVDLLTAGTATGKIVTDATGVQVNSIAAQPIILKTNNADRVTIDSAGSTYIETGNLWQYTPAPTSKAAAATLTAAELFTGILNTTGTTYTVTVPTGTNIDAFYPQVPATNIGFDFYIINTASGTITIAVNTGVTSLGALTIPTATSAQFRFRRTAANTYVMYRLR